MAEQADKTPDELEESPPQADSGAIPADELETILDQHHIWIESEGEEGKRADFERAVLLEAYFQGADLRGANFSQANLLGAELQNANLFRADLSNAPSTPRQSSKDKPAKRQSRRCPAYPGKYAGGRSQTGQNETR